MIITKSKTVFPPKGRVNLLCCCWKWATGNQKSFVDCAKEAFEKTPYYPDICSPNRNINVFVVDDR